VRTAALAVLVALAAAGTACTRYSGGARTVDPARLVTEPGWIVAAWTPTLRQEQARDCGAAALAMVAGRWGVPLTADGARTALPEVPGGARLLDMRDLARKQGLEAYAFGGDRETLLHELRAKRPVIVGLWLPYKGGKMLRSHYAVIVAAREVAGDRLEVVAIDPARGWRLYSWAALDAEWKPGGRPTLVVLGPAKGESEDAVAESAALTGETSAAQPTPKREGVVAGPAR
jgi:ABC-type bacteriocin/lantibiotic exporter with double-glycine peptidase domain